MLGVIDDCSWSVARMQRLCPRRREAAGGEKNGVLCPGESFAKGGLLPRLTFAGVREKNTARFWLPRHQLSDRLAFGASTDGCGGHGHSSCNTKWSAIAVSADSRRGSTEPL